MNILITCGSSPIMEDVVNLVKKVEGADLVAICDCKSIRVSNADLTIKVPHGSSNNYLKEMKRTVLKYTIDKILVCSDEEALTLSKDECIREKTHLDTYDNTRMILSKDRLHKYICDEIGEDFTPKFSTAETIEELSDFLKSNNQVIRRPCVGRGSRGLKLIDTNVVEEQEALVLQEWQEKKRLGKCFYTSYLIGDKFSADCIFEDGTLRTCMIRNNGQQVKYKPPTMFAETSTDKDVYKFAGTIGKALCLRGFHQIECGKDEYDNVKLIEINPRLDATLPMTICYEKNIYSSILLGTTYGLMQPKSKYFSRSILGRCEN